MIAAGPASSGVAFLAARATGSATGLGMWADFRYGFFFLTH